ncbi:TPA: DUF2264 domain-containing protein [Vibrio parahaemolyticus]|nr:DUF2264 domain-containing protein [Vibrio parahaemolyticus]HCG6494759.1 DUF2264 domain-containing protein [Vibrio parahaemolyticus]
MNRMEWCKLLSRLIKSPLDAASSGNLRKMLPVRGSDKITRYQDCTYLEFVGRTLSGIATVIELDEGESLGLTRDKLFSVVDHITNPHSNDYLCFKNGTQPLVDAAFLALAFIRSPKVLWGKMPSEVQTQVVECLLASREIKPHFNNWLLFSAMVESFFLKFGFPYDKMRIDYALRQHEQWYLGDGHYGDGAKYRADYYNSYVILPFLLEICDVVRFENSDWENLGKRITIRAQRYGEVQERMISPTGTFPPIGRSLAYRAGAFHLLALLAYRGQLPSSLSNAQVRCALSSVLTSTLSSGSNYDEHGWLYIGLNGHQPTIGENYISTGSLYLTTLAFLPLGLPNEHEFWQAKDAPWTQRKVWWSGEDVVADKAKD